MRGYPNYKMDIKTISNELNQNLTGFNLTGTPNCKINMSYPDLGHWDYKYDQNGNLIFQSGGGGNLISGDGYYREYDGNGRLLRVRQRNVSTSSLSKRIQIEPEQKGFSN